VRALVIELWTKTRIDWGFATDRIAEVFRRERALGSEERRVVAETVYGMIRQARRVDFALDGGGARIPQKFRDVARYVAYRLIEGEIGVDAARAEAPELRDVDWAAVASVDERIGRERDAVRRLGLARSLPDWLARRFVDEYGAEADALAGALNERAPLTVRANLLKMARDELAARLREEGVETRPTPLARHGLVFESRVNAFGLKAFREGLFEVQDEASQLIAELVSPGPRSLVVDACAGAGGKTLALGALMGGKGRLVALDVSARKLEELRRRARRAGLSSVQAIEVGAEAWPDEVMALRGRADRVLVDAPCSGIGALRRNPEARWRLGEEDLARLPGEQLAIVRRAADLLRPGGWLVYATCTVLRAENEDVIAKLRAARPELRQLPLKDVLGNERASRLTDPTGLPLRLLPHLHGTDGFWGTVLTC
jgi:16S rRNA (cytosine967-C5)-methyltransferase